MNMELTEMKHKLETLPDTYGRRLEGVSFNFPGHVYHRDFDAPRIINENEEVVIRIGGGVISLEIATMVEKLDAEVLRLQCDSLREALAKVLDTREKEAKAWSSSDNAKNNFSDRGAKEEKIHLAAMIEASNAEKEARLLLAIMRRHNA